MPINYQEDFNRDLENIEQLISAPIAVKDIVLGNLKKLERLPYTEQTKVNNTIRLIENIENDSLKKEFDIIYNQVCILAVSALSATIEKYFVNYVNSNVHDVGFNKNIKLDFGELKKYNFNLKPELGKIFLEKDNSINFQDLQSILRSFEIYLKIKIEINEEIKNYIIFYQQCRHIIVHKNCKVDKDFLNKVDENANFKKYRLGDTIQLDEKDWSNIKSSFIELIKNISINKNK